MGDALRLVEPAVEYAAAFIEMAEDFQAAGELRYERILPILRSDFAVYVELLQQAARGEALPPDYVASHEFWLLEESTGRILGAIRLRAKEMTPLMEQINGQVGYNIRPGARGAGYATRMLEMLLRKIKEEGWARVLITCNSDNIASARVIEKNGGRLENQVIEAETGRLISRYWIELGQDAG
jgi:predicted acetyltransferase